MVFEAHSTDYQTDAALAALVADGWGVLKVGPGLTFALREALFALAAIEDELVPAERRSTAARGRRGPDARAPRRSGRATTPGPRGAGPRPALQLQRPDALLLARPGDRGGGRHAAGRTSIATCRTRS